MSEPNKASARGASSLAVSRKQRLVHWFYTHRDEAGLALERLSKTPSTTLLTLMLLAVALALPGFALTLTKNLEQLGPGSQLEPQLALYLDPALSEVQVERFSRELLLRDDLLSVELISPDKGAVEFKSSSELGALLDLFERNPLPAVILLLPRDLSPEGLDRIESQLGAREEVHSIELDLEWVERLGALVAAFERVSIILGLFLAVTVLLVVATTIRMMVSTRLEEIEVSLLMGASPAWVRRPFLYAGFWYGLSGAVIAILLIYLALALTEQPLKELTTLYVGRFDLIGPDALTWLFIVLCGSLLGWAGAYLAVSRQLSQYEARR